MTTINRRFTQPDSDVKHELVKAFNEIVEQAFDLPADTSMREMERKLWAWLVGIGAALFAALLARRCRDISLAEIARRGVPGGRWFFRLDKGHQAQLATTFGKISFYLFAWRDLSDSKQKTRVPARELVLPLRGRCRSSELLLEFESRAGSMEAFRGAAETLGFYSHGAIRIGDNTIAAHVAKIGALIDRTWLYRTAEQIKKILLERATCDRSGSPIIYCSTDACSLRRYVDETTAAAWKMANGIRVWCVDKLTGELIHIGGEYTWGKCEVVEETFKELHRLGLLPRDGDYGGGVVARIAVLVDGQPWILDRVVGWFKNPISSLDPWHLIERLGTDAKAMFGAGSKVGTSFVRRAVRILLGDAEQRTKTPKPRAGGKHHRRTTPQQLPAGPCPMDTAAPRLIELIKALPCTPEVEGVRATLLAFIEDNKDRLAYRVLRWKGYMIGSGAMEALHPVAVQARIKLPGARWLPETSAAIFALRMMRLAGRWEEFWSRPDLRQHLQEAFSKAEAEAA